MQVIARWCVLFAIVLAPWLFGSAEPWAYLLICLIINVGVVAWLANAVREQYANRLCLTTMIAAAALSIYLVIQIAPLPRTVVSAISPVAEETQTTRDSILAQLSPLPPGVEPAAPSPGDSRCTISVSASATQRSLYLLIAYAGAFLVIVGSGVDRDELERMSAVLVISGFIMALFAMLQDFSGTRLIYWFHKPRLGGTIFGPFTNRNHFAAYMNMTFGLTLALILSNSRFAAMDRHMPWRDRIARLSSRSANWVIMLGYAAILAASAVCLSLSRGGMASLTVGLGLVGSLALARQRHAPRRAVSIMFGLLVAGMVLWLGWKPVAERLGSLTVLATDPLRDTRFLASIATLKVWGASPVFGCGFGAFQHMFPLFQEPRLQFGRFVYAHNDYAQLLAEGGLVGAIMALAVAFLFVRTVRIGFARAADRSRLFVLGVLVAVVAIAFHSVVDFSLHRPANALLFVFLCALMIVATRMPGYGRSYLYEDGPSGAPVRLFALTLLAAVLAVSFLEVRELRGELAFARFVQWQQIAVRSTTEANRLAAIQDAADEADIMALSGPRNPDAQLEIMVQSLRHAADIDLAPALRIQLAQQAQRAGRFAVQAAPSDFEYWLWLARASLVSGNLHDSKLAYGRAEDLAPPGMEVDRPREALY